MPTTGVCTIPAHCSFVDSLVAGLWHRVHGDPLTLRDAIVLVPHRRAVQAVSDAFLRHGGGRTILLPEIRALGDIEEDEPFVTPWADFAEGESPDQCPPPVGLLRRRLLLAQQVRRYLDSNAPETGSRGATAEQALALAGELGHLLDQMQTEGVSFDALATLVPDAHARHWQRTLAFLRIVTEHWPAVLREEGLIDPAIRRNRLLDGVARHWQASPPSRRIVIAGSTGTVPATARLMRVVASLPGGAVVLPGLDRELDEASWNAAADDAAHPQHALARLLGALAIDRAGVGDWLPGDTAEPQRYALLREAMRPARTTDRWRHVDRRGFDAAGLGGMARIDCSNPDEEAAVIALLLREVLEHATKTAALVTPDRLLARRVKVALRRWNIDIDDSAGQPLADLPVMTFWRLTGEMVARGLMPVALLAAFKHPRAACGMAPGEFRRRVWSLERAVLRGRAPPSGVAGLETHLDGKHDWFGSLVPVIAALETLLASPSASVPELLVAHCRLAETLAASDTEDGAARLWSGEDGEQAATFVAELHEAARDWPPMDGREYLPMVDAALRDAVFRPRRGDYPNIAILGPIEARMQAFDRVILGGLNEETWPATPPADPWMSRQMRTELGLPSPEARVGQSAHDFVQACSAPEVFFTRAERVAGAPTVPSRWLLRLASVLDALQAPEVLTGTGAERRAWAKAISEPRHVRPVSRPEPCPPVSVRPRRFSVTEVDRLRRNPYAVYAHRILGLRALEPLARDLSFADRGIVIHQALERFLEEGVPRSRDDALARLHAIGRESFGPVLAHPVVKAFWWPRFLRIAEWVVDTEARRAGEIAQTFTESCGCCTFPGDAGPVTLRAVADRIDRLRDGGWSIIDYKTGAAPSNREVASGRAAQLPLEALVLREGGFEDIAGSGPCHSLEYWRLSGGEPAGEVRTLGEVERLVRMAEEGFRALVQAFDQPGTIYHVTPDPDFGLTHDDYEHLARVEEWRG